MRPLSDAALWVAFMQQRWHAPASELLTIIDRDYVEPSNLHRQWLFEESDAAESLPKAVAAARRIARINSAIHVRAWWRISPRPTLASYWTART